MFAPGHKLGDALGPVVEIFAHQAGGFAALAQNGDFRALRATKSQSTAANLEIEY